MFVLAVIFATRALAAPELDPKTARTIDDTATEWLASTRAPSVSIAIVRNGRIVYTHAYGTARLVPDQPATTTTRYAIDSVTKEFTAAAILILAEQGKLSLDDPVGTWFPDLGDASRATLRELLSHTSGLRDFWPQDFVPPEMSRSISVSALMAEWAKRPLDYAPGTDWQYSNTGYVVAGAIVEKVSGEPLMRFLKQHIFAPLKMSRVTEDDTRPLPPQDAGAYTRYGLGPILPAPKEGAGWLFGAASLAMHPSDLALWDISLINRSLLAPASYEAAFARISLKDGAKKDYGLGLDIEQMQGRLRIGHDGAGSGFLAANRIWPDDKTAIIALTNNDWASPDDLVDRLAFAILPPKPEAAARAQTIFAGFQNGAIDRSLFTEGGNAYLSERALADLKASLSPLGPARLIELERESKRGGMVNRHWKILCRGGRLEAVERGYPDGKLEQFMVSKRED